MSPSARCDVLLTGATGFVGRHVHARGQARGLKIVPFVGDLRDRIATADAVRRAAPSAVIHLASPPRSPRVTPWRSLADDVAMTGSLVEAMRAHAPDDCVLLAAGSAAQYGMASSEHLTEDHATEPVTAYGAVKEVLEHALMAAPLREDARVIWARAFNHIGPGQRLDAPVAQWCHAIAEAERAGGGTLPAGNLEVVRDFLDVRDVADAYLSLIASAAHGVVNVCSGEPTRLRVLAGFLVEAATVPIDIVVDPALVRRVDPPVVVGDPARLRALTAWMPTILLRDSLTDALEEQRAAVLRSDTAHHGVEG